MTQPASIHSLGLMSWIHMLLPWTQKMCAPEAWGKYQGEFLHWPNNLQIIEICHLSWAPRHLSQRRGFCDTFLHHLLNVFQDDLFFMWWYFEDSLWSWNFLCQRNLNIMLVVLLYSIQTNGHFYSSGLNVFFFFLVACPGAEIAGFLKQQSAVVD